MGAAEGTYLAVDLGAGSGRVVAGTLSPSGELRLDEVHRFEHPPKRSAGRERWDFASLTSEVELGLARAADLGLHPRSVGVDGWGVDYGLLDARGALLEDPVRYRDPRTEGMLEPLLERVPREDLYARTGIQRMSINTAVQLFAQRRLGEWPGEAVTLLMVPDLVHGHLSGSHLCERTNASTTQLLDARTGEWDRDLAARLGIDGGVLPGLCDPGAGLGELRADLALFARPGSDALHGLRVVAPATHDTASAVAGTPLGPGMAYVSSGTWSLVGVERSSPILTAEAEDANFTNERGVGGTIRFLRNVMGLWLLEELRRSLGAAAPSYELLHRALLPGPGESLRPGDRLVDPDDPRFLAPADMALALRSYLRDTDQPDTEDPLELARCVLDSLALRYAQVVDRLEELTGEPVTSLRVVGGGSRNRPLNARTAAACGRPVETGPIEATATGNVLVQAIADGRLPDLFAARASIAGHGSGDHHEAQSATRQAWVAGRRRFEGLVRSRG